MHLSLTSIPVRWIRAIRQLKVVRASMQALANRFIAVLSIEPAADTWTAPRDIEPAKMMAGGDPVLEIQSTWATDSLADNVNEYLSFVDDSRHSMRLEKGDCPRCGEKNRWGCLRSFRGYRAFLCRTCDPTLFEFTCSKELSEFFASE